MTKRQKCRHCHTDLAPDENGQMRAKYSCTFGCGDKPPTPISDDTTCETCTNFDSRYIEYPISVTKIKNNKDEYDLYHEYVGQACEVRIADEKQTHIGIHLGSLPTGIVSSYDQKTGILENNMMNNPAIFVPTLKRIVWGYESWWRVLKEDDVPQGISDADIDEIPYVKLLRSMAKPNTAAQETEKEAVCEN